MTQLWKRKLSCIKDIISLGQIVFIVVVIIVSLLIHDDLIQMTEIAVMKKITLKQKMLAFAHFSSGSISLLSDPMMF